MKKSPNMHQIDRVVRLVVGLTCIYIGFIDLTLISSRPVSIVVGVFGAINLWAFITSRCPVYSAAGFSTAVKRQETAES